MKRALWVIAWTALGAVCGIAQNTFYYPHIADGKHDENYFWRTTIYLSNNAAGGAAVDGTITFTKTTGVPFELSFTDQNGAPAGSGATISFSIPAGQTRRYVSAGNKTPLTSGFATVRASGSLGGTAIFSYVRTNGQLISEAGVPASTLAPEQAVVVDISDLAEGGRFDTGIALANPGTTDASVSLQLINSDGQTVASSTRQLPAGRQESMFIGAGLFIPAPPPLIGALKIISNTPLAVTALRTDPTYQLYTTLPPSILAPGASGQSPAERYVTVAFWQDSMCSGEPTGTTAFPVHFGDTQCFSWPGRSGENSASRFSCGDQSFSYTQWTTLTCSNGQVPQGTRKSVTTTGCTQGVPPTQYARILDFSGCAVVTP